METPVYIFTGLLESGKTTLIQEVAGEEGFLDPGDSVVVQCEEGEVSLSEEFLKKYSMTLVKVQEPEELTEEFWKGIEDKYRPAQILIEYNGMVGAGTAFQRQHSGRLVRRRSVFGCQTQRLRKCT